MANGFTVSETINRPLDTVWSFLTDMNNAGQWMTGVEGMKQLTPDPIGVGTRYGFSARGVERETEITAFEPQKTVALTSTQGSVTATYEYSLHSKGDSTEVKLDAVCQTSGYWSVVGPFIGYMMKRTDSGQLVQLKEAVEAAT